MSEKRKLLDSNIPQAEVQTREAWKGGPKLSYLSGAYVIKRLNEVLGQGYWGYDIKSLTKVYEGTIQQQKGDAFTTSYISQISFWALVDSTKAEFDEVGYGDGTDFKSQGKAHELATKEAVTDGLKRAAKNLGISMGLGLYFKTQEFIGESNDTNESQPRKETASTPKPTPTPTPVPTAAQQTTKANPKTTSKVLKEQIKTAFGVLQAQKKITKEIFVKDYLGGVKVDDLDDAFVAGTLLKIKTTFPELNL